MNTAMTNGVTTTEIEHRSPAEGGNEPRGHEAGQRRASGKTNRNARHERDTQTSRTVFADQRRRRSG